MFYRIIHVKNTTHSIHLVPPSVLTIIPSLFKRIPPVRHLFLALVWIVSIVVISFSTVSGQTPQTETFNTSGTFTVPPGVTEITVQLWGAGGGGGSGNDGRGGGGGGGYAGAVIDVSPGDVINVLVGDGGGVGLAGGSSEISNNNFTIRALGGGSTAGTAGGGGGGASFVTGSFVSTEFFTGGNGGSGQTGGNRGGGGGGGSARTSANGNNGGNGTNDAGGQGGDGEGVGGDGGRQSAAGNGSSPGGGGGGRGAQGGPSGSGADGRVIISWSAVPSAANSTISADPTIIPEPGVNNPSTITITVRDESNQVMGAGIEVFFAITDGTGTLSASNATTNTSGLATATLTSTVEGSVTVTGYLGENNQGDEIGSAIVLFGTSSPNLYSYQSGSWESANNWTLDPSGTTLVGPRVPGPGDQVTILNGRTITRTTNGANINALTIEQGGTLNLTSTTGHTFGTVIGQGTLRLNTVTFPGGDFSSFHSSDGGTVEFFNLTETLPTEENEFNNLRLANTTQNEHTFTLGSDLTLNGDFTITRSGTGTLTFQQGNSTTERTFAINGSVNVGAGTFWTVNNANVFHQTSVGQDFTNNGTVRFTNQTQPHYSTPTNTGAIILTMTGAQDNSMPLGGTTDLYRFIIDKGIDPTHVLTVSAQSTDNFRLFAPNNQTIPAGENSVSNKALFIRNGTLRLQENIEILSLTEGGNDFFINQNAGLWVDGATVYTTNPAGSGLPGASSGTGNTALTVIGVLRVTSGLLDTRDSAGIIYRIDGLINLEGGTLRASTLRTSGNLDNTHRAAFIITGGLLISDGNGETGGSGRFSLPFEDNSITMSGGTVRVTQPNNVGGTTVDFQMLPINHNITGGNWEFIVDGNTNFTVNSVAPFHNVTMNRLSGNGDVRLNAPITVLNNLTIQNGTTFNSNADYNVTVGGNFNINAGAIYNPNANTTTFNGSGLQLFNLNGDLSGGGFAGLTIAKPSDTLRVSGSKAEFSVSDLFNLASGVLDDNGKTIEVQSDLIVSGRHTGSGRLRLTTATSRSLSGNGNGQLGNVELGGPASDVVLNQQTALRINGNIEFGESGTQDRIWNLGPRNLTLGPNATITGGTGSATGTPSTHAFRMFRTNGLRSAGGVTKLFETSSSGFTYPVGAQSDDIDRYAPVTITFVQEPDEYGSITVRPVNTENNNVSVNDQALTWYWRLTSSDFELGNARMSYEFTYPQSSVVTSIVPESEYVPGHFDPVMAVWTPGTSANVNETDNLITFAGPSFENAIDGEYTAGGSDAFGAVEIFYSFADGSWDDSSTWSLTGFEVADDPPNTAIPGPGSIVRVGNNRTVTVVSDETQSGSLLIEEGSTVDVGTTTGHNFGSIIGERILGNGTLRITSSEPVAEFPAGDFSEFLGNEGGTVEYYWTGDDFTLPTASIAPTSEALEQYRNLIINLSGASAESSITLGEIDLLVLDDFTIQGENNTYALTSVNSEGDLTVGGKFSVESGVFRLRHNNGTSREVIVGDTLFIASGATFESVGTTNVVHTLRAQGSIVNNGVFDLYIDNDRYIDLIFEGDNDASFTGTNGDAHTRVNTITVDKGNGQNRVLTFDVAGSSANVVFHSTNSWLTLSNGVFRLERDSELVLTDEAIEFVIAETAGLSINHPSASISIGMANSNESDLILRGLLEILDGSVHVGDQTNTGVNNDIIYASAGTPRITIDGGSLAVNGQIRRSLTNSSGSLNYTQRGGSVLVRGQNNSTTRAMFEVLNPGSRFEMSDGELRLQRGGSVSFSDFYVRPGSSNVTGGTILFYPGTSGTQDFTLDSTIPLWDVIAEGDNSANRSNVELRVNNLFVQNDLQLLDYGSLDAGNQNITVGGAFFKSNTESSFSRGAQTVFFNGNNSRINGDFSVDSFFNLTVASNRTLTLEDSSPVLVANNLRINTGATLDDGSSQPSNAGNLIQVRRSLINSGTHLSEDNSEDFGIILNSPTLPQAISGSGTFGNLIINNSENVQLNDNIRVENRLALIDGLLSLNDKRLTLGPDAQVTAGSNNSGQFDQDRMLRSFGVLSDGGVRKEFQGSANDGVDVFTFPIGVFGKYTPVTIDVLESEIPGVVTIIPVNSKHPSTRDPEEKQLNYFWNVTSTGFLNDPENPDNLEVTHIYQYLQGDVTGNESLYVTGRYVFPDWTPPYVPEATVDQVGTIDTNQSTITITEVSFIHGDYTAGEASEFTEVATYYSRNATAGAVGGSSWEDHLTWSVDPDLKHAGPALNVGEFPVGAPVIIADEHLVFMDGQNGKLAESLELNGSGVLDLENTFAHNFGFVSGTGTIRIRATNDNQFVFPGGNYEAFATTGSGGTVQFYNDTNGTLPTQTLYNNILMSDNSQRSQANVNWTVNGNLVIQGGSYDNTEHNRDISLRGSWVNNASNNAFLAGDGIVFLLGEESDPEQTIGGAFGTTFSNLELQSENDRRLEFTATDQQIVIEQSIVFNSGRLLLNGERMVWGPAIAILGTPSASSMIITDSNNGDQGILRREINSAGFLFFPVGDPDGADGSPGYSPATLNLTQGTFNNAWIELSVVNEPDAECGGLGNFIRRFWNVEIQGISNYDGTGSFDYLSEDVVGNPNLLRTLVREPGDPCGTDLGPAAITSANRLTLDLSDAPIQFIITGGDAGSVFFELAFSGNKGWRMIAFPFDDVDFADLFDTNENAGLVTQGFTGATNANDSPNLLWYDETGSGTDLQRWRQPGNISDPLVVGRGYLYYVFGTIPGDSRYDNLPSVDNIKITWQGFEQSQPEIDFQPTYSPDGDSGWNLIGNPFANNLNWDSPTGWVKEEMMDAIYIWDPALNNDLGGYLTWSDGSGDAALGGIIPQGQAFWVKVMDPDENETADPELRVNKDALILQGEFIGKVAPGADKTPGPDSSSSMSDLDDLAGGTAHEARDHLDSTTATEAASTSERLSDHTHNQSVGSQASSNSLIHQSNMLQSRIDEPRPSIELIVNKGVFSHSAHVVFKEHARRGIDRTDAFLLQPLSESYVTISTLADKQKLSINSLPRRFNAPMEIPVQIGGFIDGQSLDGSYELALGSLRDIPDSWAIELVDSKSDNRVFWKDAGQPVLQTLDQGRITLHSKNYGSDPERVWSIPDRSTDNDHSGSGYRKSQQQPVVRYTFDHEYEQSVSIPTLQPGEPIPMKALPGTMQSRFVLNIYPNGEFPELPEEITLWQNYPNPFNPVTTIRFGLPMEYDVRVDVFDILGRRVTTLVQDTFSSGTHEVTFDGTRFASGVYIFRLTAGNTVKTRKMTLIK